MCFRSFCHLIWSFVLVSDFEIRISDLIEVACPVLNTGLIGNPEMRLIILTRIDRLERQCKTESGSFALFALCLYRAAVGLDGVLGDSQSQSAAAP